MHQWQNLIQSSSLSEEWEDENFLHFYHQKKQQQQQNRSSKICSISHLLPTNYPQGKKESWDILELLNNICNTIYVSSQSLCVMLSLYLF